MVQDRRLRRLQLARDLLGLDVTHGQSFESDHFNGNGDPDTFCGEMHTSRHKEKARMEVLLCDGKGNFKKTVIAARYRDESQAGDLLDKPCIRGTPRINIWLNSSK